MGLQNMIKTYHYIKMNNYNYNITMKITLFKWDAKKSKYRIWSEEIITLDDGRIFIETLSGLEGGEMIVTKSPIPSLKTKTAEEKAITEYNKKMNDKINKSGYSIKKTTDIPFYPMIFLDYKKNQKSIIKNIEQFQPIVIQDKLDGVRAYYYQDTLRARSGAVIDNLPHINNDLKSLKMDDILIDGEIYSPDMYVTDISGIVNSIEVQSESTKLKFYIFDILHTKKTDMKLIDRYEIVKNIPEKKNLCIVKSRIFDNPGIFSKIDPIIESELKASLINGFEGIMIKNGGEQYIPSTGKSNGRSHNYKYKGSSIDEFKIVDIEKANRENDITIIFILEDNATTKQFKVTGSGEFNYQAEVYNDKYKYIGKKIRVKFLGLTVDNIPFHTTILKDGKGRYIIIE